VKSALLQSGEAFEKLVDLAKAWEAEQYQTTLTKR
jgi:hypothetical protein